MAIHTFEVFVAISTYSVLLPLLVYLMMFSKLPRANHIVGFCVVVAGVCDLIVNIFFYQHASTIIPINFYYIATFFLISLFYFELIFKKRRIYFLVGAVTIYLSVLVFTFLSAEPSEYFNSLWALGGFLIGSYGIFYVINLQDMIVDRLLDKNLISYRIINASFLWYFLVTLLLFIATGYVFTKLEPDTTRLFWSFHNIANTLKNIGLAIGLYYTGRRDVQTTLLEIEKIGRERSGKKHEPLWTNELRR